MPVVHFLNEAITVEVPAGASLYDAARKAGINLFVGFWKSYHCSGRGRCMGMGCRVWVTGGEDGAISPKTGVKEKLRRLDGNQRLACMAKVTGDVEVRTMSAALQFERDMTWEPDDRHYAWHDRLVVEKKKKKKKPKPAPEPAAAEEPEPEAPAAAAAGAESDSERGRRQNTEMGVGPIAPPPAAPGTQTVRSGTQPGPPMPGLPPAPATDEVPARVAEGTTAPLAAVPEAVPPDTRKLAAGSPVATSVDISSSTTPEQDAMIRVQQAVAAAKSKSNIVGKTIDGRYNIVKEIGTGGMGRVYLAEHIHIRRNVALKLLHPVLTQFAEVGERFAREAVAIGRINHPNCVGVSDFGALDDGSLYLVMDYLEGKSLGDLMEDEPVIDSVRALHIGRHILRGLAHAHDVGIVHRDIKPDNVVLIEQDGDPEFAKILDFGIAKIVGDAETDTGLRPLTQTGMAFGTPTYMSPEQAAGNPVDGRSDIYSLSVVLYEMIAGIPPFVAEDKLEVLGMHRSSTVPPIAAVEVDVPDVVEKVIRRGLEKRPEDRYATATEYVAALDGCLDALTS